MQTQVSNRLVALLAEVSRGGAEKTILELFESFELPSVESTLAKVVVLKDRLAELGLRVVPDFDRGELNSVRRVLFLDQLRVPEEKFRSDFQKRESIDLELKSSMLFDHKRAAFDSKATKADLRSEDVLHSCLKTIAAFLTSGGGILYVGVSDDGNILGIEFDFSCVSEDPKKHNSDTWELMLREFIKTRFKEGDSINDYLTCQIARLDGKLVARLEVSPRRRLSFLKAKDGSLLFRRQGNKTEQVHIDQVEEFLENRSRTTL